MSGPRLRIVKDSGEQVDYVMAVAWVEKTHPVTGEPLLLRVISAKEKVDVREHNHFVTMFVCEKMFKETLDG